MKRALSFSFSYSILLLGLPALLAAAGCDNQDLPPAQTVADDLSAGAVSATLALQSDWGSGYCADVTVANTGVTTVTAWQVVINLNQSTENQIWNGTAAISGSQLTGGPASWNASIAPGTSQSFGFCGTATGGSYRPTLVSISSTGGSAGAGGAAGGTGGRAGTGGASGTGGRAGSGGATATPGVGGAMGTGGRAAGTGGATTMPGTGGATGAPGAGGATSSGAKGTARAGCTPLDLATSAITRSGSILKAGAANFRAVGANMYYLQQMFSYAQQGQSSVTAQMQSGLDDAVCMGMTVIRTWGFNENTDNSSIRKNPGDFLEPGLKGLDQAVHEAKTRGLRLIITLTNNWSDYGGLPQYATWRGNGATKDTFFNDATMQGYWTTYVSKLLNRTNTLTNVKYKDEPAILAWELGNEFRCQGCKGTTHYRDTVATLAAFLKSQGATQLVADGGEGFDDSAGLYPGLSNTYPVGGGEGASFHTIATVPDLDMLSYHFYPIDWGLQTSDAHAYFAPHQIIAVQAGKVAYLGEYGWRGNSSSAQSINDSARAPIYDGWLSEDLSADVATAALAWQLVPTGRSSSDNYEIYYASHPATVAVLKKWAATTH